jgi:hypothetical protein
MILVGDDVEQVEVVSGQMLEHHPLHPRLSESADTVGSLLTTPRVASRSR